MPPGSRSLESRVKLVQGDITQLDVDAIVTAANEQLMGGGGVDGAVHQAAGPELVAASMRLAPCPTGEARITPGFDAAASYVIHAVGPIYADGASGEATLLGNAYRASLALAKEHAIVQVAFPCISAGTFGYPAKEACHVAVDVVLQWLRENESPDGVVFCCFGRDDYELYREYLTRLGVASSVEPR